MMADKPNQEFGKRRPPPIPAPPPVKRSSHVALLLMGSVAVGGGAYAMMPRENCAPNAPAMASGAPTNTACQPRGFSSGSGTAGGSWSRSSFFGGDSTSSRSSSGSSESGSGSVTRGGFGSFASAFSRGG